MTAPACTLVARKVSGGLLFSADQLLDGYALFVGELPAGVVAAVMRLFNETVNRLNAALEHCEFGMLLTEAFELIGLEGRGLAEHPGHNAGLDGLIAVGGELFVGHWIES